MANRLPATDARRVSPAFFMIRTLSISVNVFPAFAGSFARFVPQNFPVAPNQHPTFSYLRQEPGNTGSSLLLAALPHIHSKTACRGASACQWHASYEPTGAERRPSPSAPATKPAETLRFCRFSFYMCCMVMVFTLVQTVGFHIRLHLPAPASIPSSTQNAPGFAFFGFSGWGSLFALSRPAKVRG